jgi:endonuclease/exonuclease/phosphatase family metal-dependent hydrolase
MQSRTSHAHDLPPRVLRVLSYNIHAAANTSRYGEYLTRSWQHVLPHPRKRRNLEAVAELVAGYDIVGLQEADSGSLRSNFENQTQFLAELAGFPYWSHQTNRRMAKLAEPSNGLLSRLAPREVVAHALPGAIPGRGAMEVRYGPPKLGLHVLIAHLALTPRARRAQFDYIADVIDGLPHVVLLGDLNCTPDAPELKRLLERTGLVTPGLALPTFPSWKPRRALDHILLSPALEPLGVEVPLLRISDHLPLAMRIALPEACRLD